jgi:3' exoribonuclease, RNase T-like
VYKYDNLMIDLETLSQEVDAVIVTIAAVKFSFDHQETESFIVNIDPRDSKSLGMRLSNDTLEWWRKQKPEAMKAWMNSPYSVEEAGTQFLDFIGLCKDVNIWAQGIDFDMPIIKNMLKAVDKKVPWGYWTQCDCRTLFTIANFNTKNAPRVGDYHNAVDDCLTQISWLRTVLGKQHV